MPKSTEAVEAEVRCVISGEMLDAKGNPVRESIHFYQERAASFAGSYVSRRAISVAPDKSGKFIIPLVPSSAVGRYKVSVGHRTIGYLNVPSAAKANFANHFEVGS